MRQKGFALPLILGLILAVSLLGLSYWNFSRKSNSQVKNSQKTAVSVSQNQKNSGETVLPRLSKNPINEPNYLAYLKDQVIFRDGPNYTKNKYTLVVVKEDGTDKREVFSYTRVQDEKAGGYSFGDPFGKDNIILRRISSGDDIKIFDKNGENQKALNFYNKYKDKTTPWQSNYFDSVSTDNKLLGYIKNVKDLKEPTQIAVLNLDNNTESVYKLDKNYNENGPVLTFSPDPKKLYACACRGFYFSMPSLGMWEINLENGKITSLDYINQLKIREGYFHYDPNTVYGASYETYPNKADVSEFINQRSKTLYKINLDTKEIKTINFNNFFNSFSISPNGKFLTFFYNPLEVVTAKPSNFLKNLTTGEEIAFEPDNYAWSDNDKIGYRTFDDNKTDVYIYDPATNKKILVETQPNDKNQYCCNSTIDLIGWIH